MIMIVVIIAVSLNLFVFGLEAIGSFLLGAKYTMLLFNNIGYFVKNKHPKPKIKTSNQTHAYNIYRLRKRRNSTFKP